VRSTANKAENVGSLLLEKGVMIQVSKSKRWMKEKESLLQNYTTILQQTINDIMLTNDKRLFCNK